MKSYINGFINILNIIFLFSFILQSNTKKLNENLNPKLLEKNKEIKKYINRNDIDIYSIFDNDVQKNIQKYVIELISFSGDVSLNVKDLNSTKYKYQIANKIFFNINIDDYEKKDFYNFTVFVNAKTKSYYLIRYTIEYNNSQSPIDIPSYTNYLFTMEPLNNEGALNHPHLKFNRSHFSPNYLINFYSINCAYKIRKIGKQTYLSSNDGYYYQDTIDNNEYNSLTYGIYIDMEEQGFNEKKVCMISVSSTNIGNDYFNTSQQILIVENIIKFILTGRACYQVYFYTKNNYEPLTNIKICSEQQYLLEHAKLRCFEGSDCPLIMEIKLNNTSPEKDYELEVTIKSVSTTEIKPSYIIKNKIISDYLNFNSPNYYYTDLGYGTYGEVIINYYRGSGLIFGKIVEKNSNEYENMEWKRKYEFPSTFNDTLHYDSYLKKLNYDQKDTQNCTDGCYLLLTVINNVTFSKNDYEQGDLKYFEFDILIITNSLIIPYTPPIIFLPLEKYVVGSILKNSDSSKVRYYILFIPYDAQKVVFDIQSENLEMFVSLYYSNNKKYVGYKYPSELHDWKFFPGKSSLIQITKEEIKSIKRSEITSLEGAALTIAIMAKNQDNKLDSIYTLKYHLVLNSRLDIYEVYSNQQTACNSSIIDDTNTYKCLYIVKYDKIGANNSLLILPILEDKSVDFKMYADFISKDIYNLYNETDLVALIPNYSSNFSTVKKKEDFLYIELDGEEDKYLYVSVETTNITMIKLLSTISTFKYSTCIPNPSTTQLYLITNNDIKFILSNQKDIAINIVSIIGNAKIFWQKQNFTYAVRGKEDSISLLYSRANEEDKYLIDRTLIIQNEIRNFTDLEGNQIPGGLIFYMSINMRSVIINFDEYEYGKTFNFNYRNTHFPLTIYKKMNDIEKDINVFITLYHLEGNRKYSTEGNEFEVYASIIGDKSIYNIKNNRDVGIQKEKSIKGIYDPSKRVCFFSLKVNDIKDLIEKQDSKDEGENLVIQLVDKNTNISNSTYRIISFEGTVIDDNSLIPVTEKVYQYGKLKKGTNKIKYKLSIEPNREYMFLSFSSNSNELDYKVSLDKDEEDERILKEFNKNKKKSNGRIITYFKTSPNKNDYLFLTIFTKDNKLVKDDNITNYVFKYINVQYPSNINFYPLINSDISYSKQGFSHIISFEAITCNTCFITYFIHFLLRSSLIPHETFENIAIVESPGFIKEFNNKTYKVINNKINLEIKDLPKDKDYAYIQIIAHIEHEPTNEYIAYKTFPIAKEEEEGNDDGGGRDLTKLIIIISVISVLFIIIVTSLVIIVVRFNRKNKDLVNKVNATSFQSDNLANFDEEDENNPNLLLN